MAQMVGGPTQEMDATEEVQKFCENVKDEVLQKSGKASFEIYKALKYRSQVVAGTNYFAKVQIHPGGECIHVRIFRPLPCNAKEGKEVELHSIQISKQLDDPVEYF